MHTESVQTEFQLMNIMQDCLLTLLFQWQILFFLFSKKIHNNMGKTKTPTQEHFYSCVGVIPLAPFEDVTQKLLFSFNP